MIAVQRDNKLWAVRVEHLPAHDRRRLHKRTSMGGVQEVVGDAPGAEGLGDVISVVVVPLVRHPLVQPRFRPLCALPAVKGEQHPPGAVRARLSPP